MSEPVQIIVRAFDNEPCLVFAIGVQENKRYINVAGSMPYQSYIGWPISDAFDYDFDQFASLQVAHTEGNKGELLRLYEEMRAQPREYVEALEQQEVVKS